MILEYGLCIYSLIIKESLGSTVKLIDNMEINQLLILISTFKISIFPGVGLILSTRLLMCGEFSSLTNGQHRVTWSTCGCWTLHAKQVAMIS